LIKLNNSFYSIAPMAPTILFYGAFDEWLKISLSSN
jgi:hypothetical protein